RHARGARDRPAGTCPARHRTFALRGCRERRAADRRHVGPRLPSPLCGCGRRLGGLRARRIRTGRRGRTRSADRRRPRGGDPALRRHAQEPGQAQPGGDGGMTFLWPQMLWLLLLLPALVAFYLWVQRRRKKMALRYANLPLVKFAVGKGMGWRRHLPPLLMLAAVAVLVVAVARPAAVITLPSSRATVVLAIDVSG